LLVTLVEMWVAGNKFRALPYIPDKADTLCIICSQWGHSEFRCQKGALACAICAGPHRAQDHRCKVATCGKTGKVCAHTAMKCPNCGGRHPAQDARCKAKAAAIGIARGWRAATQRPETREEPECQRNPTFAPQIEALDAGGNPVSPDWTEDEMDFSEMEPSGTAPPVAV